MRPRTLILGILTLSILAVAGPLEVLAPVQPAAAEACEPDLDDATELVDCAERRVRCLRWCM